MQLELVLIRNGSVSKNAQKDGKKLQMVKHLNYNPLKTPTNSDTKQKMKDIKLIKLLLWLRLLLGSHAYILSNTFCNILKNPGDNQNCNEMPHDHNRRREEKKLTAILSIPIHGYDENIDFIFFFRRPNENFDFNFFLNRPGSL